MSEWQRDPNVLLTIVRLRGLQVGDEILLKHIGGSNLEFPVTLNIHGERMFPKMFSSDDLVSSAKQYKLVGWRRP